ncbi:hypothetical protein KB57_165 [Klebsiella phage vB_KpnM_KB57]|uniref:Uncharacterized protein n=1 Tax=Klebsiella phage vB_KpnM_KB57 TaxID=1719140 RepID=A0A0S1S1M0_9CAUD|nr:hypothetical protein KB57_165 [Klebsiella phage vB_KpnM_KB57]ALM02552.1 hypothetical protein KB57_165 [Klebsiella phage vB_KpnM_KB57]
MSEQVLEQDKYKIYEVVLVDGQFEATIRDIFTRTVRKDEDTVEVYVSYRLHEKDWWYEEILPHRVQKLNGELNFGDKKC